MEFTLSVEHERFENTHHVRFTELHLKFEDGMCRPNEIWTLTDETGDKIYLALTRSGRYASIYDYEMFPYTQAGLVEALAWINGIQNR